MPKLTIPSKTVTGRSRRGPIHDGVHVRKARRHPTPSLIPPLISETRLWPKRVPYRLLRPHRWPPELPRRSMSSESFERRSIAPSQTPRSASPVPHRSRPRLSLRPRRNLLVRGENEQHIRARALSRRSPAKILSSARIPPPSLRRVSSLARPLGTCLTVPQRGRTQPKFAFSRTDTEDADEGSVAGEPKGRYASRKNEAERRQFLEEDPNSGEVEPHRAFCKACNEWIDLNPSRRYIMKNWVEHRRSCKNVSERSERCVAWLLSCGGWLRRTAAQARRRPLSRRKRTTLRPQMGLLSIPPPLDASRRRRIGRRSSRTTLFRATSSPMPCSVRVVRPGLGCRLRPGTLCTRGRLTCRSVPAQRSEHTCKAIFRGRQADFNQSAWVQGCRGAEEARAGERSAGAQLQQRKRRVQGL